MVHIILLFAETKLPTPHVVSYVRAPTVVWGMGVLGQGRDTYEYFGSEFKWTHLV